MNCEKKSNGRIDIMQPNTTKLFSMYDKIQNNDKSNFRDALNGTWTNTPLSNAYFSSENIQIIQNGIRAGVYKLSKGYYNIGNQNVDNLKIIMRSMFLQHSTNQPNFIMSQISALNNLVLEYCIKNIYSEAVAYMKYRRDASQMHEPISHPIQADYDDKTLELKPWF
jgi:hypothetical protein